MLSFTQYLIHAIVLFSYTEEEIQAFWKTGRPNARGESNRMCGMMPVKPEAPKFPPRQWTKKGLREEGQEHGLSHSAQSLCAGSVTDVGFAAFDPAYKEKSHFLWPVSIQNFMASLNFRRGLLAIKKEQKQETESPNCSSSRFPRGLFSSACFVYWDERRIPAHGFLSVGLSNRSFQIHKESSIHLWPHSFWGMETVHPQENETPIQLLKVENEGDKETPQ